MKIKNRQSNGVILALVSAFLFSLGGLTIRYSDAYYTVWHMLFGRTFFALVGMLIFAKWFRIDLWGSNRRAMFITGAITIGGVACLMVAITLLPLFEALVLLYLYPAVAALLSPLLVGEKTKLITWFFIVLAFTGTAMIIWTGGSGASWRWAHLLAIGAAFLHGLGFTLIRRYSKDHHPLSPFFYFCLIGFIACTGTIMMRGIGFPYHPTGLFWLSCMALVLALAQLTLYKALAMIPSPEAGIISMIEAVWGGFFGYLLFQENLGWLSLVGAVLILGSGVGINLNAMARSEE
jgi:drug/metabolite transporter (DMT)-like permease